MTRTRILVAALAALALAAPAASADPHAIDSHNRALLETQDYRSADAIDSAVQAELRARGRDGAQADTSAAIRSALAQQHAYATAVKAAPIEPAPAPAPAPASADDETPWLLIGAGFAGVAMLLGAAVMLVARPWRARVAT